MTSPSTYAAVENAVSRTVSLVATAKRLDNAEMYLVLNSDVLTSMSCTYRAALNAASARRDRLNSQLDREMQRIVAALGVLRASQHVPARLAEARTDWNRTARQVEGAAERVDHIEKRDTAWAGRARSHKAEAVARQYAATEVFGDTLRGLGTVAGKGEALMGLILATATLQVGGCNATLGGFVHRAPSAHVGLWGLFSRSSTALWHVRSAANTLTRHVSQNASWRGTATELGRQLDQLAVGTAELPATRWPAPVASA